jgi:TolB protein
VSLSNDGKLLAVANDKSSSIFLTSTDKQIRGISQQIVNGQNDGLWGFTWTALGDLVYVSLDSRNRDIWLKPADNTKPPLQLTFDEAADYSPAMSPDARFIVFVSNRSGGLHIWRMEPDGDNQKQLTYGGEEKSPQVTADGKWVIYSSRVEGRPSLWRVSSDGGQPLRLVNNLALFPALSADGKWIACLTKEDAIDKPMKLGVFSTRDFSLSQTFELPLGLVSPAFPAVIRWLPDSSGIAYVITQNGISNIVVQPLSGKAPTRLTDFTADRVFWFEWTKKGDRLAVARGNSSNKVVLIEDL